MNEKQTCPPAVVSFFDYALFYVTDQGFQEEVEWCQNRDFSKITPLEFLNEYMFAVFSSSGLNYNVVRKSMDAFLKSFKDGENAFETIKNHRMKDAITRMWVAYEQTFEMLKSKSTDEDKIEYLATLRQIGKKEKYHLARNLGLNCVKPDRHMDRLAERWEFSTPLLMCQEIQKRRPEFRMGTIDVVLWRYCNLTGKVE